jgi:hypothetical protein
MGRPDPRNTQESDLTPELHKLQTVMLRYAKLYTAEYREKWIPAPEHIEEGLQLFKCPMPGFEGYTTDDINARLVVFFRCREPWLTSCKHNFSVFIKHIHRWIPMPSRQSRVETTGPVVSGKRETCPDHPDAELVDGICPICFPICREPNCRQRHSPSETCEEFKQRDDWVRRTFGGPETRTGEVTTLDGSQVFDEKAKKEFREIRTQQERER